MVDPQPKSGKPFRVLICGDRNWEDGKAIAYLLSGLAYEWQHNGLVVIEGCAKGADQAAGYWASLYVNTFNAPGACNVEHLPFPADWTGKGRAAGPIRNKQMLTEGKPDVVYAFHDDIANSKGTKNMVEIATKAGIPCYVIGRNVKQAPLPVIESVDVAKIRSELLAIEKDARELAKEAGVLSS